MFLYNILKKIKIYFITFFLTFLLFFTVDMFKKPHINTLDLTISIDILYILFFIIFIILSIKYYKFFIFIFLCIFLFLIYYKYDIYILLFLIFAYLMLYYILKYKYFKIYTKIFLNKKWINIFYRIIFFKIFFIYIYLDSNYILCQDITNVVSSIPSPTISVKINSDVFLKGALIGVAAGCVGYGVCKVFDMYFNLPPAPPSPPIPALIREPNPSQRLVDKLIVHTAENSRGINKIKQSVTETQYYQRDLISKVNDRLDYSIDNISNNLTSQLNKQVLNIMSVNQNPQRFPLDLEFLNKLDKSLNKVKRVYPKIQLYEGLDTQKLIITLYVEISQLFIENSITYDAFNKILNTLITSIGDSIENNPHFSNLESYFEFLKQDIEKKFTHLKTYSISVINSINSEVEQNTESKEDNDDSNSSSTESDSSTKGSRSSSSSSTEGKDDDDDD